MKKVCETCEHLYQFDEDILECTHCREMVSTSAESTCLDWSPDRILDLAEWIANRCTPFTIPDVIAALPWCTSWVQVQDHLKYQESIGAIHRH